MIITAGSPISGQKKYGSLLTANGSIYHYVFVKKTNRKSVKDVAMKLGEVPVQLNTQYILYSEY